MSLREDASSPINGLHEWKPPLNSLHADWRKVLAFRHLVQQLQSHFAENPYYFRHVVAGRERLIRRVIFLYLMAFVVFIASGLLAAGSSAAPGAVWVLGYLFARAFMTFRASMAVTIFANDEIRSGTLQDVCLTRMSHAEIANGWAIAGWLRAAPESMIVFAALYPWSARTGGWGAILPLIGVVTLALYQAHAALTTAQMKLDYPQRREALAAGWTAAVFIYPIWLTGCVILIGCALFIPAVLLLQLLGLLAAMLRPIIEIGMLTDMPVWGVMGFLASLYFLLGVFVIYPCLVFGFLILQINPTGRDAPCPRGYFDPAYAETRYTVE